MAPLAAPLVYAVWALFFWTDPTPKQEFSGFDSYAISAWAFAFACIILFSYVVSIAFGIPLISVLRRFNKVSFWWVVLLAAPLGALALAGVFLSLLTLGAEVKGTMWSEMLLFSLVGGAFGSVVAAAFCMLVGITVEAERRT